MNFKLMNLQRILILYCECGGKLEFVNDINTPKEFTKDKLVIDFSKEDLELIENIRTYRSDESYH